MQSAVQEQPPDTGSAAAGVFLQAVDLECVRDDRVLFRGLNFTLEPGQILQVQGRNGSGKTSLLRILCGLSPPAEGEVRWCGENIQSSRPEYFAELAYVGHAHGVKGELTPVENLNLARGLGRASGMEPVEALEHLGLAGYEDVPSRFLSAGQRRRVALARLLILQARVWVLDEPFTALDVHGVDFIESMLLGHKNRGGMVMLTTHQPLRMDESHVTRILLGA